MIKNRIDRAITRKESTTEWKNRDVKEGQEFAILTNIISQEAFVISISKHKETKELKKEQIMMALQESHMKKQMAEKLFLVKIWQIFL